MSELKVKIREWHFGVDLEPDEVPPLKKQYTTRLVYQPLSVTITVVAGEDRLVAFGGVQVSGLRVTKNGPGDRVNEEFGSWQYRDYIPDWLKVYIGLAVQMAQIELDK